MGQHAVDRDMVGYGKNPPHADWPNGARIAISVVINYEEGSEQNPGDGDPGHEMSGDIRSSRPPAERDYQTETQWEYGGRAGVWRLLRLLEKHDVKATFFMCALALARNRGLAAEVVRQGHDYCGHGYRWTPQWQLPAEEEEESIRKAVEMLTGLMGRHPLGWFTKGGPSASTREILARNGFLYDCDGLNDDLPYYARAANRPWLVVPYAFDTNDGKYWRGGWSSGNDFFDYLKNAFDVLYDEGETRPRMLSIGLHSRVSGRPGRAHAVEQFIKYAKQHEDVWFATRLEIAEWWLKRHPPATLDK